MILNQKTMNQKKQKLQTQRDNPKVALNYQTAENEYNDAKKEYEFITLQVQNEIIKYQNTKNNELKISIKNLAKTNMEYHVVCSNYWKDMFLRLDKELNEIEEK